MTDSNAFSSSDPPSGKLCALSEKRKSKAIIDKVNTFIKVK